ncbi:Serine/threonine-protein kinase [Dispira parvispora]|uniref:Serine/threonine-protein kinase n=1 Tax=Dispira parvispora TaxID=1520584 RepID=A0A9W8E9J0_9FUNG|nr:Serine/threonine-protein kinase [Dispira parvispora]
MVDQTFTRPTQSLLEGLPDGQHDCYTASKEHPFLKPEIALSLKRSKQVFLRTPLGEYEVIRVLGQGSYGKVKLVKNSLTQEHMAVKIVKRYPRHKHRKSHPDYKRAKTLDQRVLREANLSRILGEQHPNIIFLKDFRATYTHFYLFYEYIDGITMSERIGRTGLSEGKVKQYFREILEALGFCHAYSIIHRDLKLENVMIDRHTKRIKLIDFGLANFFDSQSMLATACGSIPYTAPEILRGDKYVGPEVDVWSVGILLYVMTTGMLPFGDPSVPKNYENIAAGNFWIPSGMTEELQNLLIRMLDPNVKRRIGLSEIASHPWLTSSEEYQQPDISNELLLGRSKVRIPLAVDPGVVSEVATCLFREEKYVMRKLEELIDKGRVQQGSEQAIPLVRSHSLASNPQEHSGSLSVMSHPETMVEVRNCPIASLYFLISEQMRKRRWYYTAQPIVAPTLSHSMIEIPRDSLLSGMVDPCQLSQSRSIMQNLSMDPDESFTGTATMAAADQTEPTPVQDQTFVPSLRPDSGSALRRFSSSILRNLHFRQVDRQQPLPVEPTEEQPVTAPLHKADIVHNQVTTPCPTCGPRASASVLNMLPNPQLPLSNLHAWVNRTESLGENRPLLSPMRGTRDQALQPRRIGAFDHWSDRIVLPRRYNSLGGEKVLDHVINCLGLNNIVYRFVMTQDPGGNDKPRPPLVGLPRNGADVDSSQSNHQDCGTPWWSALVGCVPLGNTHTGNQQSKSTTQRNHTNACRRTSDRKSRTRGRRGAKRQHQATRPPITQFDDDPLVERAVVKRYRFFGSELIDQRKLRRLRQKRQRERAQDRAHLAGLADGNRTPVSGQGWGSPECRPRTTLASVSGDAQVLGRWQRLKQWFQNQSRIANHTTLTTQNVTTRPAARLDITAARHVIPVDHPSLQLACQYTPSLMDRESEVLERYSCGFFLEVVRVDGSQRWAILTQRISGHSGKFSKVHDVLRRMVPSSLVETPERKVKSARGSPMMALTRRFSTPVNHTLPCCDPLTTSSYHRFSWMDNLQRKKSRSQRKVLGISGCEQPAADSDGTPKPPKGQVDPALPHNSCLRTPGAELPRPKMSIPVHGLPTPRDSCGCSSKADSYAHVAVPLRRFTLPAWLKYHPVAVGQGQG